MTTEVRRQTIHWEWKHRWKSHVERGKWPMKYLFLTHLHDASIFSAQDLLSLYICFRWRPWFSTILKTIAGYSEWNQEKRKCYSKIMIVWLMTGRENVKSDCIDKRKHGRDFERTNPAKNDAYDSIVLE
jgi:hypothetical protein